MTSTLYPLLFENNMFELVWGGQRLRPLKRLEPNDQRIGESWEISAVPGRESIISNGPLAGQTLTQVVDTYGAQLLGERTMERWGGKFPLLIKLIDAQRDLSIQVHPDDALALQRHGSLGKTEMWYVLDAEPGATLLCGFKEQITPYEYEHRVADGSICDVLARHEVHRGDVFFIPAGRVHAICSGILLAEIQESSDITYRIYDYDRPGLDGRPRQLHTAEALEAIDFSIHSSYRTTYDLATNEPVQLAQCPYFTAKYFNVNRPFHRRLYKYDSFVAYMCIEGNCTIRSHVDPTISTRLLRGHFCLIPASLADVDLVPDNLSGQTQIMEVYIDNRESR